MYRIIRNTATIAAMVLTLGGLAAPAHAAEGTNCTVDVDRGSVDCFATFSEAIRFATGGHVADAPRTAAEAAQDPELLRRMGAGDKSTPILTFPRYVVGLEFDGKNYTGDAVTFYSFWPCTGSTADIDWKVPVMPAGWDNRISSFMNFNGCFTKHFDGASYTGLTTPGFSNDQPTMPGAAGPSLFNMDNRTSSLQFS